MHPSDSCKDFAEFFHVDLRVDLVKSFFKDFIVVLMLFLLLDAYGAREDVH